MIEPIIFAAFLFFLITAAMLHLLDIRWVWSLLIAAFLTAAVVYSALSTVGAL